MLKTDTRGVYEILLTPKFYYVQHVLHYGRVLLWNFFI